MNNTQVIELLLGAIASLAGVIGVIYRESAQRSREYAEEWRDHAKEQQKVLEDVARTVEQIVNAISGVQKSEEAATDMLRDLWYRLVRSTSAPPVEGGEEKGGVRGGR